MMIAKPTPTQYKPLKTTPHQISSANAQKHTLTNYKDSQSPDTEHSTQDHLPDSRLESSSPLKRIAAHNAHQNNQQKASQQSTNNALNTSSQLKSLIHTNNSIESVTKNTQQRLLPQKTQEMQKKFTIDKQEYQSVFRVIDKDNSGQITVDQVNTCLHKIDTMHRTELDRLEQQRKDNQPQPKSKPDASKTKGYLRSTVVQQVKPGAAKQQQPIIPQSQIIVNAAQNQAKQEQLVFAQDAPTPGKSISYVRRNVVPIPEEKKLQNNKNFISQKSVPSQGLSSKIEQPSDSVIKGRSNTINNRQINAEQLVNQPQQQQQQQATSSYNSDHHIQQLSPTHLIQPQQPNQHLNKFPSGKQTMDFDEFVDVIRDACMDQESAENYLVLAFSMFDVEKKGYINCHDLKGVFELLGETVQPDELQTMVKIASQKAGDKITFRDFVDFFYKLD